MSSSALSLHCVPFRHLPPLDFDKDLPASPLNASLDSPVNSRDAISFALRFIEEHSKNTSWTYEEQTALMEIFMSIAASSWDYLVQMANLLIQKDDNWMPGNKIELLDFFSSQSPGELEDLIEFTNLLSDRSVYLPEDILATATLLAGFYPKERKDFVDQTNHFLKYFALQRQKKHKCSLSPKERLLLCEELAKLSFSERANAFVTVTRLLSDFDGCELFLLKSIIQCQLQQKSPSRELLQENLAIKTSILLSRNTFHLLREDLEFFLDAAESNDLVDSGLEILYEAKIQKPAALLKQISVLFKRGKWSGHDRLSALKMLAKRSYNERDALIRQVFLLYKEECWGSEGILQALETLVQIERFFREDIVQKTLLFVGELPYEADETLEALKIIDEIGEFDRPSVLKDIQLALPKTAEPFLRNIFLELFGTLHSEARKYFITHRLIEYTLFFLTPSYQKPYIKNATRIIAKLPTPTVASIVERVTHALPDWLDSDDRNQILEAFIGLSEAQTSQLLYCVENHLHTVCGIEVAFVQSQVDLMKNLPEEAFLIFQNP